MEKVTSLGEMKFAPLRTLDDFILSEAKFQIPNVKDLEKWGKRVVNNLLYYQTNYLFMFVCIFLIVGCLNPVKMLTGFISMAIVTFAFAYFSMEGRAIHYFKRNHPTAGIAVVVFICFVVSYSLGSMLVFLFGILLPFSAIFVHASLRLRNIKNKIANKLEGVGLSKTPAGYFLECLGMEIDLFG